MSKGGLLLMAAQFVPRLFQVQRGTWLVVVAGLMVLLAIGVWAALALFGWLWGQGKSLTGNAPEVVRDVVTQVEQVVPGARERLGEWVPALKPEPPLRDVSGTDIGPVVRYPGLARTHWQREDHRITVRYAGRAEYPSVLAHYVNGFAAQGYTQGLVSAAPDSEVHDYHKGDERIRFELAQSAQGKVNVTIIAVLP